MVEPLILCYISINALTRDPICLAVIFRLAASQGGRAPGEPSWLTFLILPLLLLAPGQLSLTAGVASADSWYVSGQSSASTAPLPLLHTGAGVKTGRHVGSGVLSVSAFILSIVVAAFALALAALGQVEGDVTAAPLAVLMPKCRVSTDALF